MKTKIFKIFLILTAFLMMPAFVHASEIPVLNFSDIISGPAQGNTDGAGGLSSSQHGAIVTVWGNFLGSTQSSSKIYFTDSLGVKREAAHVYYWKDADGSLPGGPADLFTYHKMQEIAFSIPAASALGVGQISVSVGGVNTSALPFEVRNGNIFFIKSTGNDTTGDGSWSNPWLTINQTVAGGNGKIAAGDIVYSDGAGETNGVTVGSVAPIAGTSADHISMIAYPNSRVDVSGNGSNTHSIFYNGNNPFWNWSKISLTTAVSGFALSEENRIVGVEITGPTVYAGASGAIGGNCADVSGCTAPSGGKYFGNYIHNYGTDNGVPTAGNSGTTATDYPDKLGTTWDLRQHVFSVSNRSGSPLKSFEIGWNNLKNNPVYQGINIFDRSSCGDWNDAIKIHNNVIKNQRGFSINVDFSSCSSNLLAPIEIHDNLIIQDPATVYAGAAFSINAPTSVATPQDNNKIYQNTIFGFKEINNFVSGNTELVNNIVVDRMNLGFFNTAPTSNTNNLFYSTFGLTGPNWATQSLNTDPLFANFDNEDFSLAGNSPAISAGSSKTVSVAQRDFFGRQRITQAVSLGAFQAFPYQLPPAAPTGLGIK